MFDYFLWTNSVQKKPIVHEKKKLQWKSPCHKNWVGCTQGCTIYQYGDSYITIEKIIYWSTIFVEVIQL